MSSARFINSFLYPDFSSTPDITFVFNPFNAVSDDSSSTLSSDEEVVILSCEKDKFGEETSHQIYASQSMIPKSREEIIGTEQNLFLETDKTLPEKETVPENAERLFPRVSFTTQISSDTTTSPLDDMDLIDIILKHGVHRELKSLAFRKECVQEPPSLSPVSECIDDNMTLPSNKMLHFDVSVLDKIRMVSLGCFMGKHVDNTCVLPVDGLTCSVHLLYSEQKNKTFIISSKLYAKLDLVTSQLMVIDDDAKDIGEPIGVAFASYILSENTPIFILEQVKSTFKVLFTGSRIEFFTFIDVMSENLMLECFEYGSNRPMLFNIVDGNR